MNKKESKTCDTGHNENGHKHFVRHKNLSLGVIKNLSVNAAGTSRQYHHGVAGNDPP